MLLDIGLPDGAGWTVDRRAGEARTQACSHLAMTGHSDSATRNAVSAAGCDDVLIKRCPSKPSSDSHGSRNLWTVAGTLGQGLLKWYYSARYHSSS